MSDTTQDQTPEEQSLTAQQLQEKRAANKKKLTKQGMILAGVVTFGFFVSWLFAPFQGGVPYGICKTFLELQVKYPQTLQLSTVDQTLKKGMAVRIWFTQLDPYGEYRLEPIECLFRPDPVMGAALEKVTINRIEVDPKKVAAFNAAIPGLVTNPPDLDLPTPLPDSLRGLQIDPMALRPKFF